MYKFKANMTLKFKTKSQMDLPLTRFIFVLAITIGIILITYTITYTLYEKNEKLTYSKLKVDLQNDFKYMSQNFGASKKFSYQINKPTQICFVDIYQINPDTDINNSIIKNSIEDKQNLNVFFPEEIHSKPFFIKDMHISKVPHYFCKEYKPDFFILTIQNINKNPYLILDQEPLNCTNNTENPLCNNNQTTLNIKESKNWCYIHNKALLPLVTYEGNCSKNRKEGIDKKINDEEFCDYYNFIHKGNCSLKNLEEGGTNIIMTEGNNKTNWCFVKPQPSFYRKYLKKGTCAENKIFNGMDIKNPDYSNNGIPNFLDPDIDGDGMPNFLDSDIDGDGIPNHWEEKYGLDPYRDDAHEDLDKDGLTNLEEYNLLFSEWKNSTDPRNPDSDGDGWPDGIEIEKGYNPMDPKSHPKNLWPLIILIIILLLIIIISWYYYKYKYLPKKLKPQNVKTTKNSQ